MENKTKSNQVNNCPYYIPYKIVRKHVFKKFQTQNFEVIVMNHL